MIALLGKSFEPMRRRSLWILFIALLLSILGHLILFFGLPFISLSSPPPISEDLIIKTELRIEPPQKIQLTRAPKKTSLPKQSKAVSAEPLFSQDKGGQGASGNQSGQLFNCLTLAPIILMPTLMVNSIKPLNWIGLPREINTGFISTYLMP